MKHTPKKRLKILESVEKANKTKNKVPGWVSVIGDCSGWKKQTKSGKISGRLLKPKKTDPNIPILLCNLFWHMSKQIESFP